MFFKYYFLMIKEIKTKVKGMKYLIWLLAVNLDGERLAESDRIM